MTEYFVYCDYDDCYCPRATFIPYNSDPEIQNKINQIIGLDTKIENCYKKEDNQLNHIGYKIKGVIDNSENTREIISYWSTLLHRIDHDHEGELPDEYRLYYINDENRNCSPLELYKLLSEMTEYEDKQIIVRHCVMVSNVPFNIIKKASMEFFSLSMHSSEHIKKIMLDSGLFDSVICATKDDGMFAGYGFVELINNSDYNLLINKCASISDIKFSFK